MPSIARDERFLPYLTTRQIGALAQDERALVVLPVASIEQHGPHLPVFTDSLITEEVLQRALALLPGDLPVWTLPLLAYGKSNEHGTYAGTITLPSETFISVLKAIARSVARSGFRRLAILNGHGGNSEIVDFVIRDIREETGMQVFALQLYLRVGCPTGELGEQERTYGIHAGEVETSILLCTHPDLVARELAPASLPAHLQTLKYPPFQGPLTFAWLTQDITDTGVLGDATAVDAAKGERFLAQAATEVADLLAEMTRFHFAPSATG